ncbi:MAG: hypothetical protein AB1726_12915 [Planctomycetota bacterium]
MFRPWIPALLLFAPACVTAPPAPIPGAAGADHLIEPGETHLAHLWKLTRGGENAEAYWSFDGRRLVLQRRNLEEDIPCDRIFVVERGFDLELVSTGTGVTTCAYFLPGDRAVLFASTHGYAAECPPPIDFQKEGGYVWAVHAEYDLYVRDLDTGELSPFLPCWGYDAEATVSPRGDRVVFTSTRGGDIDLWTCNLDGSNLVQVTDTLGYDGGAFFSHDGTQLVYRSTFFTPGKETAETAVYRELLARWRVRPHHMEIMLADADGGNRRQITHLGGANFAPFFFPDDTRVIFSTNHHETGARNFDLFAIGVDGEGLERITTYAGFDSFPVFSPDGRFLVFASNRGGERPGETNIYVAEWR